MGDVERVQRWSQPVPGSAPPITQSGCAARSPTARRGRTARPRSRRVGRVVDGADDVGQRPEPVGERQPVADLGLVPVVDLHDVDRQVEVVDGVQVLLDVGLGDPGEVVVPGAPDRGRRPQRAHAGPGGEPIAPPGQRLLQARALDAHMVDRAVGGHGQPVGAAFDGDRRDGTVRGGGAEHVHPLPRARVDREQALAPEGGRGAHPVRPVVADPALLADRARGRVGEPVGGRRAPRLPAVLVHPRPGGSTGIWTNLTAGPVMSLACATRPSPSQDAPQFALSPSPSRRSGRARSTAAATGTR